MAESKHTTFPKRFLWGASVSAHQVEGGNHNQWSVWELENAKSLAAQAPYQHSDLPSWDMIKDEATNPDNYVSGDAVDHYNRYEEDFNIAAKTLHMNAFRFSIEWSRIEPREGVWDPEQIEFYRRYIKSMKARGLEPIMTLFHFTIPVWFAEKGGFEKRKNVKLFLRFVEKVVSELGEDIRYILTVNEIGVYTGSSYVAGFWPPAVTSHFRALRVFHNLIYAHKKASKLIHKMNRRYKVSLATNMSNIYAGDDALLTRVAARIIGFYRNDYLLRRIKKHCDFIGLNYYFNDQVFGYRIHNSDRTVSDMGWDMKPRSIQYVMEHIQHVTKLPVLVSENGVADRLDQYRAWWLSETLIGIRGAMDSGVTVLGYVHWSLLDNFEWREGKWPRFGLVEVDYQTMERTVRPSALKFAKLIRSMRSER